MAGLTRLYPWQLATRAARLPLTCKLPHNHNLDIDTLRSEVAKIVSEFSPAKHFRSDHHDGGWKAIGLVAHAGNPFEDRKKLPFEKTPALALAPHIEELIGSFRTGTGRVRLMELQPGKSIFWHYDAHQTIDGEESVRLHIPVVTNDGVKLQISHENESWKAGEVWYGDFSFPHRLHNGGQETRIHLVMDLDLNDAVLSLFPESFLIDRDRRLRVKKACQTMVDLYALGRLPPRKAVRAFRKIAGGMVGRKKNSAPAR